MQISRARSGARILGVAGRHADELRPGEMGDRLRMEVSDHADSNNSKSKRGGYGWCGHCDLNLELRNSGTIR